MRTFVNEVHELDYMSLNPYTKYAWYALVKI